MFFFYISDVWSKLRNSQFVKDVAGQLMKLVNEVELSSWRTRLLFWLYCFMLCKWYTNLRCWRMIQWSQCKINVKVWIGGSRQEGDRLVVGRLLRCGAHFRRAAVLVGDARACPHILVHAYQDERVEPFIQSQRYVTILQSVKKIRTDDLGASNVDLTWRYGDEPFSTPNVLVVMTV